MTRRAHKASVTTAERLRLHRQALALALQLRCTPKEAEQEILRKQAAARSREARRKLYQKLNAKPVSKLQAAGTDTANRQFGELNNDS